MATAKYGTKEQREFAEAVSKSTSRMVEHELQNLRSTKATIEYTKATEEEKAAIDAQIKTMERFSREFDKLVIQYKNGKINAEQFVAAVDKLDVAYGKEVTSAILSAEAEEANTKAKIENANADEVKTKAKLKDIVAQKAQTVATKAQTVAEKALNGVRAIGQSLLATLQNPMTWMMAVPGIIKLITSAFKSHNEEVQEAKESYIQLTQELDGVNQDLEEANQKIDALKSKGTLTITEQDDLDRLREQVALLEEQQRILEESSQKEYESYNKGIQDQLSNAGYDFSDTFVDRTSPYGATRYSGTEKAFDLNETRAFAIELGDLYDQMQNLTEGTDEYNRVSIQFNDGLHLLELQLGQFKDAFGEIEEMDFSTMDDETRKLASAYLEIQGMVNALNEGTSVEGGIVKALLGNAEIEDEIDNLVNLAKQGKLTREELEKFDVFKSILDSGIISADQLAAEIANVGTEVANAEFESFDISGLQESAEKISNISDSINDDIMNLFEGNYDSSDILRMTEDYEGFRDVANATVAEQIAWLQEYKATASDAFGADVQAAMSALNEQYSTLTTRLQEIGYYSESAGSWVPYDQDDSETIMQLEDDLVEVENKLKDVQNYAYIDVDFNMGDAVSQINSMISAVDGLVEAQNKLASGTALSQQELWKLAQTYPELLSQINLFSASSVSEQEAAISAVLDMKNQEKNAIIDGYIIELQAKADALTQQIALEDQKAAVLDEIHAMELQGKTTQDADYQDKLAEYNELEKQNYYNLEEDKVVTNNNANATIGQNEASASQNTAQIYQANADALAAATAAGAQAAGNNIWAVVESTGRKIAKLEPTLSSLSKSINAAFAGAAVGISVAKGNGSVSGLT